MTEQSKNPLKNKWRRPLIYLAMVLVILGAILNPTLLQISFAVILVAIMVYLLVKESDGHGPGSE